MKNIGKIVLIIVIIVIGITLFMLFKDKNNSEIKIEYNYYKFLNEDKFGVLDKDGNVIIEANYSDVVIPNPTYDVFFLLENNVIIKVVNEKNNEIFTNYETVLPVFVSGLIGEIPYEKNVLIYNKDGNMGLINFKGEELTKPIYKSIESIPYKEGELLCKTEENIFILKDNGKQKVKEVKDIDIISDGYYDENNTFDKTGYITSKQTQTGLMYGYINYKGKKELEIEFDEIKRIKTPEEYLIVKKNGQYGLYKNNKVVVNCNYQEMKYEETLNLFFVRRGNNYGVLNEKGDIIVPVEYKEIASKGIFFEAATHDNEIKKFDLQGKETNLFDSYASIEKTKYDSTYLAVSNDFNYEILDKNYNTLTNENYEYIENILSGIYIVKNSKGKYGVINEQNNKLIDIKYDVIQLINGTEILQAMNIQNNNICLYDKLGNVLFEEEDALIILENEYVKVFCNDGVKYFTLNSKEIKSSEIYKNNNILGYYENGKWGFKDKNGNVIIDAKYERISELNYNGYGGIKLGDKWGIIDSNGKIIVEPKFYIDDNIAEPEFLNKFYKSYYASTGAFYIE